MKKTKSLLTIVTLLSAWAAIAQSANEFTIPLSDPAKRGVLRATLHYGSITVKGTARKDVLVKYVTAKDEGEEKRERKNEDGPKAGLKKISGGGLELDASENANTVKIGSDSWNNKTSLEIEVPQGFDLKVGTYNDGDLTVSGVQGDLELNNYNGSITALNISGSVVASTYNGDIKVTFDRVSEGTPMSYSTYNGDVDLTFPSAAKASFKMKTERGDIYTGFDMNITSSGPVKQEVKSGGYKLKIDEWKRGDINGGGSEFTMKNYNGDIYIRKK